jgi:hypothetical protein
MWNHLGFQIRPFRPIMYSGSYTRLLLYCSRKKGGPVSYLLEYQSGLIIMVANTLQIDLFFDHILKFPV